MKRKSVSRIFPARKPIRTCHYPKMATRTGAAFQRRFDLLTAFHAVRTLRSLRRCNDSHATMIDVIRLQFAKYDEARDVAQPDHRMSASRLRCSVFRDITGATVSRCTMCGRRAKAYSRFPRFAIDPTIFRGNGGVPCWALGIELLKASRLGNGRGRRTQLHYPMDVIPDRSPYPRSAIFASR